MCIFASRQCADYGCESYVGAGKVHMARVTLVVEEAVWCVRIAGRRVV